jgi:hypothetical protein
MKFRITEKKYLLFLSILLVVGSIFLLMFVTPNSLGYDLALSLISTGITVFFLDLMLIIREEREWANVEKYVHSRIAYQNSMIVSQLLRFVEPPDKELFFKVTLSYFSDETVKSEIILRKLTELKQKEPLTLTPYASDFNSNKESLKIFLDVKNELADIQIRYSRQLRNPVLIERLQKIQDALSLLYINGQIGTITPEFKNQITAFQNLKSMNPTIENSLDLEKFTETTTTLAIKALINEIKELWNEGIKFNIVV